MDLYMVFFILAGLCILFLYLNGALYNWFRIKLFYCKSTERFVRNIFWLLTSAWFFSFFLLT